MDAETAKRIASTALLEGAWAIRRVMKTVHKTGKIVIDDRSEASIPLWVPKMVILEAFALAHGVRRTPGLHIVLTVRDYLATPDRKLLSGDETVARLRQYATSEFSVLPFVSVKRRRDTDALTHFMDVWEANPPDMYILTILTMIPSYWLFVALVYLVQVDWTREVPLFYDWFTATAISALLIGLYVVTKKAINTDGPMPTWLVDFGATLRIICFLIVVDMAITTRPAMFLGEYVPPHRQHLVSFHHVTLAFVTAAAYVKGGLAATNKFDRSLYVANFVFGWFDLASTMGSAFAYAGDSPIIQGVYYGLWLLGIILWVFPMLWGLASTTSGMMKQVLVISVLVDAPMFILALVATATSDRSPYVVFDLGFKSFQLLRVSRILFRLFMRRFRVAARCGKFRRWCGRRVCQPLCTCGGKLWRRIRPAWCDRVPSCKPSVWRHRCSKDRWRESCSGDAWRSRLSALQSGCRTCADACRRIRVARWRLYLAPPQVPIAASENDAAENHHSDSKLTPASGRWAAMKILVRTYRGPKKNENLGGMDDDAWADAVFAEEECLPEWPAAVPFVAQPGGAVVGEGSSGGAAGAATAQEAPISSAGPSVADCTRGGSPAPSIPAGADGEDWYDDDSFDGDRVDEDREFSDAEFDDNVSMTGSLYLEGPEHTLHAGAAESKTEHGVSRVV